MTADELQLKWKIFSKNLIRRELNVAVRFNNLAPNSTLTVRVWRQESWKISESEMANEKTFGEVCFKLEVWTVQVNSRERISNRSERSSKKTKGP